MAKNQTMFYATETDLGSVLSALEAEKPLKYTLMGLFNADKPQAYPSYASIPEFGRASHPTAVANASYLVSTQEEKICVREVPQQAGGILFAIDQSINENTIVLRPAGRYGNNIILYGMFGTVSQSAFSKALYSSLLRIVRKKFVKNHEFFVGQEAWIIWNAGARLTIRASSPLEFDLKRRPRDDAQGLNGKPMNNV